MKRWTIFFALMLNTIYAGYCQKQCVCADYLVLKSNSKNKPQGIAAQLMSSSDVLCKAKGYELMSDVHESAFKLDSAMIVNQLAEKLYIESGCSDTILLNTYKIRAQIYYSKADYVNAQTYSLKMIHCAEKGGNTYEQAKGYTMTAQIFNQTNQADIGINYTRKAAKLLSKLTIDKKFSVIPILCSRYLWHYQDTKTMGSLDTVEIFSRQYLTWAKNLKNNKRICKAYNLVQAVAYEKKDFKSAITLLDSSFIYLDKQDTEAKQLYYYDKADLMIESADLVKAQIFADSVLHYAFININPSYIAEAYDLQERIAYAKGDFRHAYEMNKLKDAIDDSIRTNEKMEAVTELEKKYTQVKNEGIIKDLDKKNQLYLLLTLAGLLGFLALGFYLRQQKLKHQQDILETEQRLNRARMNPHFFFNALATLQKFALRDNDGQALASNLSKFSNIMRETLESTYKEYITVEQETDFLNEYLEVQKIRFPNTFSYAITTNPDMEVDDILIPSMILQPFIENSIEHGFAGIAYPGHIDINFKIDHKELMIEISDNGMGLNTKIKENNEHISRAGQIIKDRIYLLNIKLKTKAGFSIDNNKDGVGTIVKIHLPLLFQSQQN